MANRDAKLIERTLKDFSLDAMSGSGGAIYVDELPQEGKENTVYILNNSTHEGGINWFCLGGPGRTLTDMWYGEPIYFFQTYEEYEEALEEQFQYRYAMVLETNDVYYNGSKLTKLCYGHYIDEENYREINLVKGFGETTLDYIYLDGSTGTPSEEMDVYCWYCFQSTTENLVQYGAQICFFGWRKNCISLGNGLYSKKIDSTKCIEEVVNKTIHDSSGTGIMSWNFYTSPELPRTFKDIEYVTLGDSRYPKYTYIDEEGNVYLACWTSLYYMEGTIEVGLQFGQYMRSGQWYYAITDYFTMSETEIIHKFADWSPYTDGNGISSSVLPVPTDDMVIHWVRYSYDTFKTPIPEDEEFFIYKPLVEYQDKYVWEKGQWFDYTEAMFK